MERRDESILLELPDLCFFFFFFFYCYYYYNYFPSLFLIHSSLPVLLSIVRRTLQPRLVRCPDQRRPNFFFDGCDLQ